MPSSTTVKWSEVVNGLSGRLCVQFENLNPGLHFVVYLELLNKTSSSVVVTNSPLIEVSLSNINGEPIIEEGFTGNGPKPSLQWASIPKDAYTGLRIDVQDVGLPASEKVLLAFPGKTWALSPGTYRLNATVEVKASQDGPVDQWTGILKPPPIELLVTPDMINGLH